MKKPVLIKIGGLPLRICIFLFPVVAILCFYVFARIDYDSYLKVVYEDGPVEYLTSAFYLMSSIIAARISISFLKHKRIFFGLSYAFLACGMFFVFGEEISWGQRILHIVSPQFFAENNRQGEMNLHNLDLFGVRWDPAAYILLGSYGAGAWLCFLMVKKYNFLINPYFIPKWYLATCFFPVSLNYAFFNMYRHSTSFLGINWHEVWLEVGMTWHDLA